jgi:hypothetical protein
MRGALISEKLPDPIVVKLDPELPGVLLPMYYKGILLMTDYMVTVLRSAGVSNLQIFNAAIQDPFQGKLHTNYKVVNIVGVISAANLKKSIYKSFGEPLFDVEFDSLHIDDQKVCGSLMFRLAENITGIVVDEKIKIALEAAKVPYLNLTPTAEWLG